jgi:hypothetical protein
MSLNSKQFRQTRLFAPLGMMKQPHQMTPIEFANSPRTMIHGSDTEDFEELRTDARAIGMEDSEGFHMGTVASADERMRHRTVSSIEGYYHPVRPDPGAMVGSKDRLIKDEGTDWEPEHFGHYYRNAYEDKGSISAVVESPNDVTHYADYVHEALGRGGIPSATAEHFATQLDNEHSHYSPGIPRGMMNVQQDEGTGVLFDGPRPGRSRIEPRQDLYDSPSARVWGRQTDGVQGAMLRKGAVSEEIIKDEVVTYGDQPVNRRYSCP